MPLRKANELGHGATNQIALPRDALQPVYSQTASSYYQNLQVLLGIFWSLCFMMSSSISSKDRMEMEMETKLLFG